MLPEEGNETGKMVACTLRSRLIFTFVIPASCLFIILIFPIKKKVFVFLGASVPSLISLLAVILCVHAVVLCLGVRPGVHNTRLLAASADARLVHKYFSSTKGRARNAACV